ncbi:MAG: SH3 domain-containing protein [Leptospirales bacterium]|nr:SH3 domain-containing protein [Leptospirales bacterium]
MDHIRTSCALLLLLATASALLAEEMVVTASELRLRRLPDQNAAVVGRLHFGEIVQLQGAPGPAATLSGRSGRWRQVRGGSGAGWAFDAYLHSLPRGDRSAQLLQLAAKRLGDEALTFSEAKAVCDFLSAQRAVRRGDGALPWELAFYQCVGRTSALVASDADSTQREWLQANGALLREHELAGIYVLKSELLWDRARALGRKPIAEDFAWTAAGVLLGGECEGFLDCDLSAWINTYGEFLKRYPRSSRVGEALRTLRETMPGNSAAARDYRASREDLPHPIAQIEAILAPLQSPEKRELLQLLRGLPDYEYSPD